MSPAAARKLAWLLLCVAAGAPPAGAAPDPLASPMGRILELVGRRPGQLQALQTLQSLQTLHTLQGPHSLHGYQQLEGLQPLLLLAGGQIQQHQQPSQFDQQQVDHLHQPMPDNDAALASLNAHYSPLLVPLGPAPEADRLQPVFLSSYVPTQPEVGPQEPASKPRQPPTQQPPPSQQLARPQPTKLSSSTEQEADEPDNGSSAAANHQSEQPEEAPEPGPARPLTGLAAVGLNDDCLQCICRAASGCDHLLRCITRGADHTYCGPFQLTEEYWRKAGAPEAAGGGAGAADGPGHSMEAFEDCANEPDCAMATVRAYMQRYKRDCDADDHITCLDYARLHRLRPGECRDGAKLERDSDAYWAKFERCAESYANSTASNNADDEDTE